MKHTLLALLVKEPAHGYELKQAFESLFGAVQAPLNAGQIYTTLARLERDGFVENYSVEQDDRPNKRVYQLTPKGREEVDNWIAEPVLGSRLKDEFFTKLIVARQVGIADPSSLIEQQRREYLQDLRNMNDLLNRYTQAGDTITSLLIEGVILHLQADLKWLDRCEEEFT